MFSPAKINLLLRVLRKRSDGFHEIETLMAKLPGLADEITITPAESFSFTCDDPSLPTDGANLIVKAVEALSKESGEEFPFHIHLEKRIPHGAGLGGGSSNAATTLLALNGQLAKPLAPETLHSIAAALGSDVPFFLYAGSPPSAPAAEKLSPQPQLHLHSPSSSSSQGSPCRPQTPTETASMPNRFLESATANSNTGISRSSTTLNNPSSQSTATLAELKDWLLHRRDTKAALMSGSGSTVFAILRPNADPKRLIGSAHKYFDPNLWTWSGTL